MLKYIWAFDLSMSNSGIAIFTEGGMPICIFSISTSPKSEHKDRLKAIGDKLLSMKEIYPPKIALFEKGFSRFNVSTQTIFMVQGLVQYLFSECEQRFYPPSTVKKLVTGDGRADKQLVKVMVESRFGNIHIENYDQSDSLAVGVCYFLEEGVNPMQ